MKLSFKELERGAEEELKKSAFLGKLWDASPFGQMQKGMNYLQGGGLMKDISGAAMSILPILGMMGGGGSRAASQAAPKININLGGVNNPLTSNPGVVRTFGAAARAPKLGGLLDFNVLKTVLTARATNDAVDAVQGKNNAAQLAGAAPMSQPEVELTTRYPEIKKILADPQSRAYLESLLTKDASYGT